MEVLLATKNTGKIAELKALIEDLPLNLHDLSEFQHIEEVEETGSTFAENAVLKAASYARQTGFSAIADDSGLEVFALNRAPGIYSARYGGENSTDSERIQKLLMELGTFPRKARFVCAIAFADQFGNVLKKVTGICNGRIATQTLGTNGFGYDPIFIPDGFEHSFGELTDDIKSSISHRARAIKKIIQYLRGFEASSLDQSLFRL